MLRAIRHHDLNAFRARVEPFLLAREAEHNLMLGLLASWSPPILVEVSEKDQVIGAALCTPPFNLIVTALDEPALALVADAVGELQFPGVLGASSSAAAFAREWTRRHGLSARLQHRMRIHSCTRVIAPAPPADGGQARVALADDLPLVHAWTEAFSVDAQVEPPDPVKIEKLVRAGAFRLWQSDRPVAMAATVADTPTGARVAFVYTPKELRGRGYASAVTAALTDEKLRSGRMCFLYTDLANPTSNKIYAAVGYSPVCDVDEWRFA